MVWISLGAAVIATFLAWNLYMRFGADRLEAFDERRRGTSHERTILSPQVVRPG